MSGGRAPSWALLAAEPSRAITEYALFQAARPVLSRAPRGDGHPVLVLPGFGADDRSTTVLRRYLRGLGYSVHAWRLGRNVGPTAAIVDGMTGRLAELAGRGERAVSIVGWSLGSHCGLGHNPTVLWIVADRLAQPQGGWRPYPPRSSARLLAVVGRPAT